MRSMTSMRSKRVLLVCAVMCWLASGVSAKLDMITHAIQKGDVNLARKQLQKKDPNYVNREEKGGMPVLTKAILHGQTEIAKMIIEELNANVDVTDNNGGHPLEAAAFKCDVEIAKLIRSKMDTKRFDPFALQKLDGFSLLHRTTWEIKEKPAPCMHFIDWLIEEGIDVNVKATDEADRPGHTALLDASMFGQYFQIYKLLNEDANMYDTDKDGNTGAHILSKFPSTYAYIHVRLASSTH